MKIYVVFGADYCLYCHKAVELLEKSKKKFFYFDIKTDIGNEMLNKFISINGDDYPFIPQIYLLDSKFIKGFTELKIHLEKMAKKTKSLKQIKKRINKHKKHVSSKKSKKSQKTKSKASKKKKK